MTHKGQTLQPVSLPAILPKNLQSAGRNWFKSTFSRSLQQRQRPIPQNQGTLANPPDHLPLGFQQKGTRLETEFDPSIPTFRFDYQKVQQAAANLLDHALRQALSNSIVTMRCLSRPEGVEVNLTGATEHDQKVFDNHPTPYSRPRDYQESLGVGFTIAKRLIRAHGGRIWVEPSSTGSKFVFVLPMDARAQEMEVDVGFAGFADPTKEQVECSVCHKTAIYGDVMVSLVTELDSAWWGTNESVFTCPDCVKKALGPENWERVRAEFEAVRRRAAGQEPRSL